MTNKCARQLGFTTLRAAFLAAFSVVAGGILLCPDMAHAAIAVPSSVSPGQVGKRFKSEAPAENLLRLNIPTPTEPKTASGVVKEQLEKKKFVLNSVTISGGTVYGDAVLEAYYKDSIGKTISLQDAKDIAARITARYRGDGYILSQAVVPAQDISKGELSIRVVEGFISQVSFEGGADTPDVRSALERYVGEIKASRPIKMADLERYMLLMNDLPGNFVSGLIRPSSAEVGGADLVLSVNRQDFEGSYSLDNRGSKYIGPWQHTVSFGANSLITPYDRTSLRVETATPFKELFGIELDHDMMLNSEGTKLSFLVSHTRTQPGDDLKSLRIVGNSDLFEVRVSHPFLRSRSESFTGRAVIDVHNTTTDVFSDVRLNTDRLRVVRLGGVYNFLDTMDGSDSLDVQVSQGLNIFDATDGGVDRSNPIGDSAFTKLNFSASRVQQLPNKFSVLTSAVAQYSFVPLLSDEQFSVGGTDYGRAFDPSEALGDTGIAAKAEVRYTDLVGEKYLQSYQPYAFYDVGEAWSRGAGGESKVLSSVGIGVRANFTEYLSSSLEAAAPIVKPGNDQTSYRHNPRVFFTLTAHF